jgi:predicted N-acetyltransferase YhbS
MYHISPELPQDTAKIEQLLDKCFGPDRFQKTVYAVRKNLSPIIPLRLVAKCPNGKLLASIRYWPLLIDAKDSALLLGPIAVDPDRQGEGIGVALITQSLQKAKKLGFSRVILVGDPEYYNRFGFVSAVDQGLELPGPVDLQRFLIAPLVTESLDGISGMVSGDVDFTMDELHGMSER